MALACFGLALVARGAAPPLLEEAVQSWLGERDHWAFTQRAVEYRNGKPYERIERFDPSKPDRQRWELLTIDGKPPTPKQRADWEERKFKAKRKRFDQPIGDFFDFAKATVRDESAQSVRYLVPLRNDRDWLFPTDKVDVIVTVNKRTRALDHLAAEVREPFRVLLGVARIMGGSLDIDFLDEAEMKGTAAKAARGSAKEGQPSGKVSVSVTRLGERIDFTWTDFKRVTPLRNTAVVDRPREQK